VSDIDLSDRHILLVEDEFLLARNVARRLEGWGATILGPAGTVAQAIELLGYTDRIDLAVLDINLQHEIVFPVADALRTRRIPFMFTTGYGDLVIPERFSVTAILQKPISTEDLASGILTLIALGGNFARSADDSAVSGRD
jgi:DNA-binding LytR/AlgR family response regulator